jgi:hypothetical protein
MKIATSEKIIHGRLIFPSHQKFGIQSPFIRAQNNQIKARFCCWSQHEVKDKGVATVSEKESQ